MNKKKFFTIKDIITNKLINPLNELNYTLPSCRCPEISFGKYVPLWLKKNGFDLSDITTYEDKAKSGKRIFPKSYPIKYHQKIEEAFNDWLHERAMPYFKKKEPNAVPYIQKIINNKTCSKAASSPL